MSGRTICLMIVVASLAATSAARADKASSYYHQAMALKRQGKVKAAIKALKDALLERDDYAAAHRSIGILYRQKGQYRAAIAHLERASKLQPKAGDVYYSLGLAYFRAGDKGKALAALRRAVQLKPKDERVLGQLGVMLLRSDPEQAIGVLTKAIKIKRSGDTLHQLGLAYRRASARAASHQQKDKSKRYMRKAEQFLIQASVLKDSPELHFDLGVLYRRLDKTDRAISHYEKAVEANPKFAAAWWDLGHMYTKAKQVDEAIKAYKKYVALRAGGKSANIARARIEELKKKAK